MKSDITREALLKASERILAVSDLLHEKIPFGPASVQPTPDELRRAWQKVTPDSRTRLLEELGYEKLLEVLRNAK